MKRCERDDAIGLLSLSAARLTASLMVPEHVGRVDAELRDLVCIGGNGDKMPGARACS